MMFTGRIVSWFPGETWSLFRLVLLVHPRGGVGSICQRVHRRLWANLIVHDVYGHERDQQGLKCQFRDCPDRFRWSDNEWVIWNALRFKDSSKWNAKNVTPWPHVSLVLGVWSEFLGEPGNLVGYWSPEDQGLGFQRDSKGSKTANEQYPWLTWTEPPIYIYIYT